MNPSAQEILNGMLGQVVSQIRLDFSLSLFTDDSWYIVVESSGSLGGVAFSGGAYVNAARQIAALHRRTVSALQLNDDHSLSVTFDDGSELVAGVDPVYDSWHVVGPDRQRIHVEGAGRVTIFDTNTSP